MSSPSILHQAADATWEPDTRCRLSILISANHCTGVVFDKGQQKFVFLKSFVAEEAGNDFMNPSWLKENFPNLSEMETTFFLSGNKTTLVPEAVYNERLKRDFLKINHPIENNEEISGFFLKHLDAHLLYAEDAEKLAALKAAFQKSAVQHSAACWLESLSMQYKNEEDDHMHIDFADEKIDVAFFRNGSLHLFNSFLCQTDEDRLYFPLFISEQLRVNPKKDKYYLSGYVEKGSSAHELFRKYITNLHLEERPPQFRYSLPVMTLPEHFYYKAYCTPVCAY